MKNNLLFNSNLLLNLKNEDYIDKRITELEKNILVL